MPWVKTEMNSVDLDMGKHIALQDAFEAAFMAFSGDADLALFSRKSEGTWSYILSPEANKRIRPTLPKSEWAEISRPTREGTSLLVGIADARDRLLGRTA